MIHGRAMVTDGQGGFRLEAIEVDPPQPGEVLVALRASGVCHTDYDSMRWGNTLIMGHEGAGVVAGVGEGVDGFVPGDHVLLNWAIPCYRCFQCRQGNFVLCEDKPKVPHARTRCHGNPIGRAFELGTMSTHTVVPPAALVKMDQAVPFASACIVGCGVMTGVGSVLNVAEVPPGSSMAVLGCGGVGLNVIQGGHLAGATMIIAVDVNPARLEMARRFGATHSIRAERNDAGLLAAATEVKMLTGGRGADYAFECTAVPALGAAPLAMVRHAGMAVQVSGIEQKIEFDMELFEWNKRYINPLYGNCDPRHDFSRLLDHYRQGELQLDELVTRTYPLEDLAGAFRDMHAGKNAKGVLLIE